jgi:hypothetical protein
MPLAPMVPSSGFFRGVTVVTLGLSTLWAVRPFLYQWALSGKRLSLSFGLSLLRTLGAAPLSKAAG